MKPSGVLSEDLEQKIRLMPKTEIHVHIEGATTPETIWKMAARNKIKLPAATLEEWKKFYQFKDFNHFIDVYMKCCECMITPEDFTMMVEDFYEHQAGQNILYTECFLSASLFIDKMPFKTMLDALEKGRKLGEAKHKVRVEIIPDIGRNLPQTQDSVTDFVIEGFRRGIFIGLGLGGIEEGFPAELFTENFKRAREAGLRLVSHAGEAAGAESVWGSIKALKAERIGHGFRCLEDPELVKYLREHQIPIEVSPKSNYRTCVVKEGEPHPIHEMLKQGLYCTVNSDDPTMFSTSLIEEYRLLAKQGMSWEQLWNLNLKTLEATFLPESEKKALKKKWDAFYSTSL